MITYNLSAVHVCSACKEVSIVKVQTQGLPPMLPELPPHWKRIRFAVADGEGIIEEETDEYCKDCHPVVDA